MRQSFFGLRNLVICFTILAAILVLTIAFASGGNSSGAAPNTKTIEVQNGDGGIPLINETKPILISIATLIGLIGLTLKIGIEMQKNAAHRDNKDIHQSAQELLTSYRRIADCDSLHGSIVNEVKVMQQHVIEMKEMLGRVDERTKKLDDQV